MSKTDASRMMCAAARIVLAWVFVLARTAWPAQAQNAKQNPESARKAGAQQALVKEAASKPVEADTKEAESAAVQDAAEETSGGGPHEGIKVYGHWTIEVRNPDGTLVTHREFENSFDPQGPAALAAFLSRQSSVGVWQVQLNADVCGSIGVSCFIVEPISGLSDPVIFQTLTLSRSIANNDFILSGTATAAVSGTVIGVLTGVVTCPPTTPVATPCGPPVGSNFQNFFQHFTSAPLIPTMSVSAGQTIAATVVISFS